VTLIDSSAPPIPTDGVIWSQGAEVVAVHATVPLPDCVSETSWGPVRATNSSP
jgi:hypothetical protein